MDNLCDSVSAVGARDCLRRDFEWFRSSFAADRNCCCAVAGDSGPTHGLSQGNSSGFKTSDETHQPCEGISWFETESMGRGLKEIRAHRIGDLLLVRLTGVLTASRSPER